MLEAAHGATQTAWHSHHAIQITLQLDGRFELRTSAGSSSGPIAAVLSDTPHMFFADGAAAHLFVEPESHAGRALAASLLREKRLADAIGSPLAAALQALRTGVSVEMDGAELRHLGQAAISKLADGMEVTLPDPRVRRMMEFARANLDEHITLGGAADQVCLSPSRARHLFVANTGLPFKAYLLWLRLERAVQLYAAGRSLTEAAHYAGFADSAHFSRTFRRKFGITAASLRLQANCTARVDRESAG